jgi:hypothetical protein
MKTSKEEHSRLNYRLSEMQVIKGLVMPAATHFTYALESWLKQIATCQTRNLLEKWNIWRYQSAGYIVKAGVLNLYDGRLQRIESFTEAL